MLIKQEWSRLFDRPIWCVTLSTNFIATFRLFGSVTAPYKKCGGYGIPEHRV
ncbi:MAG: hypothetical protein AAFY21_08505 [Cyanobacteria bacterium J06641_2]